MTATAAAPSYAVENFPPVLTDLPNWVVFRTHPKPDGRLGKRPFVPGTNALAEIDNPATWRSFADALADARARELWLGVAIPADLDMTVIDLDGVIDPDGAIDETALVLVAGLDSYTERSVSRTGLHVLCGGHPLANRAKPPGVEIYPGRRFLLITGDLVPGLGRATVENRADRMAVLFPPRREGPRQLGNNVGSPPLMDDEVIANARAAANGTKFVSLWAGETSGHDGDDSAADLALISLLAFWTQDAAQLDRLFRRSGLYREKWERLDYRERTIAKTLDRSDFWEPGPTIHRSGLSGGGGVGSAGEQASGQSVASWPTLDPAALHGLPGDVVRVISPHTEGDPVAILVNYLLMAGNAIGSGPFVAVGGARHGVADFAAQVGETAKARKGTAYADTLRTVKEADLTWAGTRVTGGLSSGEGLIFPIRDPVEQTKKGETVVVDAGVPDKRLLCLEEEFSAVLKVATREGNTLTEQLRKAWDGRQLGAMTRNSPLRASGPHVSILAHITKDELLRVFDSTDAANGFGNRFAWFAVRRSKFLPEGGQVPEEELADLVERTRNALAFARRQREVRRDEAARRLWAEVYPTLSDAKPGLLGALAARAEAHVLRWSLLYALLDEAPAIGVLHLLAALALWDYAEASIRHVFGDATGDPIADRLLAALRANGPMTQAEVVDLFGRNVAAARLGRAQESLLRAGLIRSEQEATGGRPRTVWRAT